MESPARFGSVFQLARFVAPAVKVATSEVRAKLVSREYKPNFAGHTRLFEPQLGRFGGAGGAKQAAPAPHSASSAGPSQHQLACKVCRTQ